MITIKLTREEATELFIALNTAEAGFSPTNAVAAADNINALHSTVSSLDKGKNALSREVKRLGKDVRAKLLSQDDFDSRVQALVDGLNAKGEEVIEIELHPLKISDEEFSTVKFKPGALAVLRRWLVEPKK